jgi:membrane-associated HD superfamily phosphohydrolase
MNNIIQLVSNESNEHLTMFNIKPSKINTGRSLRKSSRATIKSVELLPRFNNIDHSYSFQFLRQTVVENPFFDKNFTSDVLNNIVSNIEPLFVGITTFQDNYLENIFEKIDSILSKEYDSSKILSSMRVKFPDAAPDPSISTLFFVMFLLQQFNTNVTYLIKTEKSFHITRKIVITTLNGSCVLYTFLKRVISHCF